MWFVGLEEAGCDSSTDLEHRLKIWKRSGMKSLLNCRQFHIALAKCYRKNREKSAAFRSRFEGEIEIQHTWARLICLYLACHSEPIGTPELKEFQSKRLDELLLIEFMPLPVRSTSGWIYEDINISDSSLKATLKSRALYRKTFASMRVNLLKEQIKRHKPRFVISYGKSSLPALLGIQLTPVLSIPDAYIGKILATTFLTLPHPAARASTSSYSYWAGVGQYLHQLSSAHK